MNLKTTMGNEVETQVWPDVESLMSSARSLDEVLRARGSTEDFKQGTDMFAYLKDPSGNKDSGKGQGTLSGHCSKKGGIMKTT